MSQPAAPENLKIRVFTQSGPEPDTEPARMIPIQFFELPSFTGTIIVP